MKMKISASSLLSVMIASAFLIASFASLVSYDSGLGTNAGEDEDILGLQSDFTGYIPVSSPADLAKIGSTGTSGNWPLNGKYCLTANITLTGSNNHTPIGTQSQPFTGTFDGNGKTIAGLNMSKSIAAQSTNVHFGLFGCVSNAKISDLTVNGTISITMSAQSDNVYLGGIIGLVSSTSSITNCNYQGSITLMMLTQSSNVMMGGIAGYSIGPITNCYSSASLSASVLLQSSNVHVGGISGRAYGSPIVNCYNTGSVSVTVTGASQSSNAHIGGIAGSTTSSVTNCYNIGTISVPGPGSILQSTNINLGGIAGYGISPSSLTNCYNIGALSASAGISQSSNVRVCGIVGYIGSGSSINNCYYLTDKLSVNGTAASDALFLGQAYVDGGGTSFSTPARIMEGSTAVGNDQRSGAKTLSQMKTSLTSAQNGSSIYYSGVVTVNNARFTGWDFSNVWTIDSAVNNGYPVLRSFLGTPSATTVNVTGSVKDGTTGLASVKISYTTGASSGSVLTDSSGNYTISVPSGSVFTITAIEKSGYKHTGQSPFGHYLNANKTYNFVMEPGSSQGNNGGGTDADPDGMLLLILIGVVVIVGIAAGVYFLFLRKH